jgi:hypothetical protein
MPLASGEGWLDAAVLDGWRPEGERPAYVHDQHGITINFDGGAAELLADKVVTDVIWPVPYHGGEGKRDAAMRELRRRSTRSRAEMKAAVDAEIAEELARRERWKERLAEVSALPQLFIAV